VNERAGPLAAGAIGGELLASGRPGDHHPCDLEPEFGPARMESVDANKLFEMALGVGNGWQVVKSEMDVEGRPLQLWLDFAAGSQAAYPGAGIGAGCTTRPRSPA